jgi:sarcosine oxidase subunit delta
MGGIPLHLRDNPKGVHAERWRHHPWLRALLQCVRDTVTDKFLETYKAGETAPEPPPERERSAE